MLTYVLSFIVVSLAMLGLAVGVVNGRPQLKGRCGRRCRCARPRCKEANRENPSCPPQHP